MLLILVSWIYITFTTINLGYLFNRIMNLKVKDFAILSILGFFAVTLIASIWAVFGRIHFEFHICLFLLNFFIFIKNTHPIIAIYSDVVSILREMPVSLRILFGIIAGLIVAQCSSIPYVIDNESYYIQSIKWINEHGLVKGLANLHFFLAQSSGWHITQGALNFSFLYDNFNDLSGFCLLMGNLFAFTKLNAYFQNSNKFYLATGLLPIANVFFFQFISAPSPDIPVYILSFIIFFYFIERFKNPDPEIFSLIVVLVLFSLYIKTTAAAILLIPGILLIFNFKGLLRHLLKPVLISFIVLSVFVAKNSIISGYPLFPFLDLNILETDYKIPEHIAKLYYQETKLYGFFLKQKQYEAMSAGQLFVHWLMLPKLHGLFNKISIMLIFLSPFFIYKYINRKEVWILYIAMCLQMILLYAASPQYRFFMNFLLLFSFVIASTIIYQKKWILSLLALSVIVTGFVLLVPINLNRFTNNKFVLASSNFSVNNIIHPHKDTKLDTDFEFVQQGNLKFYSPIQNDFFWVSGDGPLPCVNKKQIELFKKKYKVLPQLRTRELSDGFYAKTTQVLLPSN